MIIICKKYGAFISILIGLTLIFFISTNTFADDNIEISISTSNGIDISGVKVYAFKETGSYTGANAAADSSGIATFDSSFFESGNYKFRVDYLGSQFWSDSISLPDTHFTSLTIQEEAAEILVKTSSGPSQSIKVYLFSGAGSYLGINKTTDINGQVYFDLPVENDFKFRADILGNQYWSDTTTIQPGTNDISIDAGGGILQVTIEKNAGSPLEEIKTYLFNTSGSYLGIMQTTNASGIVQFNVPAGDYKVRTDYLGYQYWSAETTVEGNVDLSLPIPHQDIHITIKGDYQGTPDPIGGIKVYLFNSSGSYMGQNQTTDNNGQVLFNLPQNAYKVRADYMGQQFWSEEFTWQNTSVDIPMSEAEIILTGAGQPLENVKIYLFSEAGNYLGINKTTDSNGNAVFRIPSGSYKFRADYQGSQYWSNLETLVSDQSNSVSISTGGGIFSFSVSRGASSLEGAKCYLFSDSGSYLGLNETSDSNGEVHFSLSDGSYKVRVDYLGSQFWSDIYTVPYTLSGDLNIQHQDVTITVQDIYQSTQSPIQGIKVYLFSSSGAYLGLNETTIDNGQVLFNLPEKTYKVRADYMGQQFWSEEFTWQDSIISIPNGMVNINVLRNGDNVQGARVYLFSAASAYLGKYEITDSSRSVSFLIPSGSYLFRADDSGEQKWSDSVEILSNQTTNIDINFSEPPVVTASVDPATVLEGESSVLTWETTNAETVSIEPGIGAVGLSGSITLSPSVTTDYIITAQGPTGTVNQTITINVVNTPLDIDYGVGNDEQEGGGGLVGDTVRVLNGNVLEYRSDLSFSSPNQLGFDLEAFYNSRSSNTGAMGYGWSHTYEVSLDDSFDLSGITLLKITDSTGKAHYFYEESTGIYKGVFAEKSYVKAEGGGYVWYLPDGSKFGFLSAGQLQWMDDAVGNRLALSYTGNVLTTVTDNASGRVLTFYYDGNGYLDYVHGPVTSAVTNGIWVDYTCDASHNLTSVTYADNSGFDYTYDDTNDIHNLTRKENKAGNLINAWAYDTTDRAIANYSREGKGADVITYQTSNQVDITDAYGKVRTYYLATSAGRKRVLTISDGAGGPGAFPWSSSNAMSWSYDNNMNPSEIEYTGGAINLYRNYDERGNPGKVYLGWDATSETALRTIEYTYHPNLNTPLTRTEPSVLAQPGGLKETIWDYDDPDDPGDSAAVYNENPTSLLYAIIEKGYTKDSSGTLISYTYTTRLTYNTKGQVTSINGPRPAAGNYDDVTSLTYNPATGDLLSVTRPHVGSTTLSAYDNAGQVSTVTDVNSQSKTYTYDGKGRVTVTTNNADNSTVEVTYTAAGEIETKTDEDDVSTSYYYNDPSTNTGLLYQVVDSEGNYIKYTYDDEGNVVERGYYDLDDNLTKKTNYLYQGTGHNMPGLLFKEINADAANSFTQYTYDLAGNVQEVLDPEGNATDYTYDDLNRLKTVTQYLGTSGITTSYEYDGQGNLISVEDAEGHITTYQYDDMGRLVSTASPDTGTVTYVYDEAGNPVSKKDEKDITVTYDYDFLNRLTDAAFPAYGSLSAYGITYTYDSGTNGIGHRTGMTDPSGSTSFAYDSRGRLTDKTTTINGQNYPLSRTFTSGGRTNAIIYPSGREVNYQRNAGCACKITDINTTYNSIQNALFSNMDYRPFGGVKSLSTGGGGTVGSIFDNRGRMTVSNPNATHQETYTYDNAGNITSLTAATLSYHNRTYGYDDLYRIDSATGPWGSISYTYDDVGNRQSRTIDSVTDTYAYVTGKNVIDSITTSTGTIDYSNDDNGNITAIGDRTLTYNQNNRLIKVEDTSGTLGEYTYNGLGQRVKKEVGETTTVFHYDFDGNIISESDLTGNFTKEYIYKGSSRIALIDYVNEQNGEIYFYGNDTLGTPLILTDSNDVVVWEAVYKPFGEAEINPHSTVESNFRFKGQYYDNETGFHYNFHRYYEPSTGRYLTPDPIGLLGGINCYIYAENNSINTNDPYGLQGARFIELVKNWYYLYGPKVTKTILWIINQKKDGSPGSLDWIEKVGAELYCETKDIDIGNEMMWFIMENLDDAHKYVKHYFKKDFPKDYENYMDWWYPELKRKDKKLRYMPAPERY